MPKVNYGSKKNTTFKLWLAFDVSDSENPEVIASTEGTEGYWKTINELGPDKTEFHYIEFARPGWALDAYLRELALTGEGFRANSRVINQDRLIESRLRYLVRGTSLLENPITLITSPDGHQMLSDQSWAEISDLSPIILRYFGLTACQVFDSGVNPNTFMTDKTFEFFRNNKLTAENVQKWMDTNKTSTSVDEEEVKKKSGN